MIHKGYYFFRDGDELLFFDIGYEDGKASIAFRHRRPMTENELSKRGPRRLENPTPRPARGGCSNRIHKWLGIRWYGTPWLLRWKYAPRSGGLMFINSPGCGCMVRIKKMALAAKQLWKVTVYG